MVKSFFFFFWLQKRKSKSFYEHFTSFRWQLLSILVSMLVALAILNLKIDQTLSQVRKTKLDAEKLLNQTKSSFYLEADSIINTRLTTRQALGSNGVIQPPQAPVNMRNAKADRFNVGGTIDLRFPVPITDRTEINVMQGGSMISVSARDLIGKNGVSLILGSSKPFNPITVVGQRIILNLNVMDMNGSLIAEIINNKISPAIGYNSKIGFDRSAVEVLDSSGRVAFSLEVVKDTLLALQGYIKNGVGLTIFGRKSTFNGRQSAFIEDIIEQFREAGVQQIFDYTGSKLKRL